VAVLVETLATQVALVVQVEATAVAGLALVV